MKALIAYFTMGGRTKKAAEAIASSLTNYDVTYFPVELTGKFIEKIKMLDKYENNDFSSIEAELSALDVASYDLVLIGMPTYGNKPPKTFDEIIVRMKNLSGKKVVTFTTARFSGKKALEYMNTKVEAAGGKISNMTKITRPFYLGKRKASKFGKEINEG